MAPRLRALVFLFAAALPAACSVSLSGYAGPPSMLDASDDVMTIESGPVDAGIDVADAADASSAYAAMVLAAHPILYFRLDEETGASGAKDLVTGRTGAFRGIPVLGAKGALANDIDTAMRLDGTNGVTLANIARFAGKLPYSLEAWVRPTDVGTANGGHVVLAAESGGADGYSMYYYSSYIISIEREYSGGNDIATAVGYETPSTRYSHVVGTYDGVIERIYVDGAQRGTKTSANALPATTTIPFAIGGNDQASSNTFIGDIDEVAIYDHVLSESEIRLHYQVGMGTAP